MVMSDTVTIIKAIIDISFIWILIYTITKGLKDNVKMVFLLKGVIILGIVKILSDWLDLRTTGLILEYVLLCFHQHFHLFCLRH